MSRPITQTEPEPLTAAILADISERHFGWHNPLEARSWEQLWIIGQLDLQPGIQILDAGAGRSPLPFYCADRGAAVFTADSGSPDWTAGWGFVDYGKANPAITSWNRDFSDLAEARDQQFDCIYSISVVEHMPAQARRRAWVEFSRILKPAGKLALTIDLEQDGFHVWNRSQGLTVETTEEHGTLASVLQELAELGFILNKAELYPNPGSGSRPLGLLLTRGAGLREQVANPTEPADSNAANQMQLARLEAENQQLKHALHEQASTTEALDKWAHELEADARTREEIIRRYQRLTTPFLPLARLMRSGRRNRKS